MLSRIAKFSMLILLVISLGGQWAVLQSVAWAGMLIDYARDGSVTQAVRNTFDGQHPCCLCKAIAAGKKSEQKKDASLKLQKLEFPPVAVGWAMAAFSTFPTPSSNSLTANGAFPEPPTPPPRVLPS